MPSNTPTVVVTGANGFVGAHVCSALIERGAEVRAVVRRAGTAPRLAGLTEVVGDFSAPEVAAGVVSGATAVLSTVHPMSSDRETQHRIGVEGTSTLARAAASAGVERLIHISTAAVYDRSPGVGDVSESSALVGDDTNDYAFTKRDADLALAGIEGITRVLVRPPAILGPGPTSVWNTIRPQGMRDDESDRQAVADQTFAWVHLTDLASFTADLATGRIPDAADPTDGPVTGACTPVNVADGPARVRDYFEAVSGALGVDPVWLDKPAWTGQILAGRARGWGWTPTVDITQALAEVVAGLGPI